MAPLRAWDDFFPGSDRFARPDFKDISKWNNRVVSNLLYYQTNYLMVAAAVVAIVGSVPGRGPGVGDGGSGGVAEPRDSPHGLSEALGLIWVCDLFFFNSSWGCVAARGAPFYSPIRRRLSTSCRSARLLLGWRGAAVG